MSIQKPDENITCQHTGHEKKCCELFLNCPKWIQIQGKNPNTGAEINEYNCADTWHIVLLMENSKMQQETAAAIESFRNEMVKQNSNLILGLQKTLVSFKPTGEITHVVTP